MKYALVQTHEKVDVGDEESDLVDCPISWSIIDTNSNIEPLQDFITASEHPEHYIIIQIYNE